MRLSSLVRPGFRLLSGDDRTAFGFTASGGDGCVSLLSNIAPDTCRIIFSNLRLGRLQSARQLQERLGPLEACLSKDVPAALKHALCLLGLMQPNTRLPIMELDDADKARVARALASVSDEGLIGTREGVMSFSHGRTSVEPLQ